MARNGRPRMWGRCQIPDCDRDATSRGYCPTHYAAVRFRREGMPDVDMPRFICTAPGCDGISAARGLCYAHYQEQRRRGWSVGPSTVTAG